jgi:hypothetical protein
LSVARSRLEQLAAEGQISPEALAVLRARHDDRSGRLPRETSDGIDVALVAAELRSELIAAEREFIYQLLRDGRITDEARRRIERELDLEEAGIACKKEGGVEPPLWRVGLHFTRSASCKLQACNLLALRWRV